jgi:hypothetical protein
MSTRLHEFKINPSDCMSFLACIALHPHNNCRQSNFLVRYRVRTKVWLQCNQFQGLILHFKGIYYVGLFADVTPLAGQHATIIYTKAHCDSAVD